MLVGKIQLEELLKDNPDLVYTQVGVNPDIYEVEA